MNARSGRRLVDASVITTAAVFCFAPAPARAAAGACSVDTFAIAGTSVKVTLCPAALKTGSSGPASVAVAETIEADGGSFTRSSELDFFDGATTSRSIDDVPLAKVGIAKTLHLTIGYKAGAVHIEHALLVPGAIALK